MNNQAQDFDGVADGSFDVAGCIGAHVFMPEVEFVGQIVPFDLNNG